MLTGGCSNGGTGAMGTIGGSPWEATAIETLKYFDRLPNLESVIRSVLLFKMRRRRTGYVHSSSDTGLIPASLAGAAISPQHVTLSIKTTG